MALSIGISKGSRIDVDGHEVRVKAINGALIVISVEGKDFLVSDQKRVEILPEVYVSTGIGKKGGSNRLAFEAPLRVRISRVEGTSHRRS